MHVARKPHMSRKRLITIKLIMRGMIPSLPSFHVVVMTTQQKGDTMPLRPQEMLTWQHLSLFYATLWIVYEWYDPLASYYGDYSIFETSAERREVLHKLALRLDEQYS
jgi:hypothetical protein